jgi:hypothetical protein
LCSLGVLVWECFTGQVPYEDVEGFPEKLMKNGCFLPKLPPTTPLEIRRMFKRTQEKEPSKRPTFEKIQQILQKLVDS